MNAARNLAVVFVLTVSGTLTGWLIGQTADGLRGHRMAPWIVARASGIAAYLLLVALVLLGLLLAHPWRTRLRRPSQVVRIRLHATVAVATLVLTALHVVVLATDEHAGVGWTGALLPLGSEYRPVPVTLGVLGLWTGLAAGVTAAAAHHLPAKAWWPVHKVAVGSLVLVWLHGVLAGSDTPALRGLYLVSGALVLAVAVSRYTAHSPADAHAGARTKAST